MKRKISRTNLIDPSPIRSSENQFNAAKGDEAKTSEYAFFKKLKTNASHRFHSRHSHTDPNQFKSCDSPRERSSGIKNSSKELRLPAEDVTHVNRDIFLSPVVEVDLKRASTTFGDICSTRRNMEEYNKTLRLKGTHNQHQDLFSTKRQKLHQWVADISFPEIKELCSKGYEFVSVLLSRLFPESGKDNSFKIPRSVQVQNDAKSKFLASPSSNIHLKNLHQISTRKFMDVECDPYLDSYSSRERTLSNFDSPTSHAHSTLLEYYLREPICELGEERNAITWTESNSAFSFPFEKYGYYSSSHRRELDNFHYPDGSLLRRKEHALLLGWDSENVINERTSSAISQNTELIMNRKSLTSWGDNHVWNLDDGFGRLGASGLCESPLIRKHPSSFYSLPPPDVTSNFQDEFGRHYIEDKQDTSADLNHFPLTLSHRSNFGRHYIEDKEDIAADLNHCPLTLSRKSSFGGHYIEDKEDIAAVLNHYPLTLSRGSSFGGHYIEDKEDIVADLNHCPLTLSHRPSYLSLTEDSNHETTFNVSMSFLSPGNHPRFMSKFPTERYHDHKTEALLSSKLDFDLGRKCLSICDSSSKHYASIYPAIEFPKKEQEQVSSCLHNIDEYEDCLEGLSHRGVPHHISNDIVNIEDWSSFYFQISPDRKRVCPLLLDKSSWDVSEGETYHANSEGKYI
ncbi:hypothetical protein LWI29_002882 [Acer saccharum]|uniref:Uncharacterized protein n=1 Tax=Acer saccharum TaxID=4024 RepID=A0AA39RUP9_ACESA|nr:hypothetical protein LWI29_002882 [Acer saccharum]